LLAAQTDDRVIHKKSVLSVENRGRIAREAVEV
jgi:hypothetical protein